MRSLQAAESPLSSREASLVGGCKNAWERIDLPNGLDPHLWLSEITHAFRNDRYFVTVRPIAGHVTHLAVRSFSGERPSWHDLQRIKNDLAGEHATAVEVFPPSEEVVDGADVYHLWVLPDGLPFGLRRDRYGEEFRLADDTIRART